MRQQPAVNNPPIAADRLDELEQTCFIIMPFGNKKIGDNEVDFNAIFNDIFKPAVAEVCTPEGRPLNAARTDQDSFSGAITQEMFEYLMYSRLAFGDISGFNANVLYEIGVRHAVQESGTVLFRQSGHAVPYDISTIKVFEYTQSPAELDTSRALITRVLSDTLKRNRLDSPVRLALRGQWGGPSRNTAPAGEKHLEQAPTPADHAVGVETWRKQVVEDFLRDAQAAIRMGNNDLARTHYWGALRFDRTNIIARMRLGVLLKQQGKLYEALEEFTMVTKLQPDYGEAWREKGIMQSRLARLLPECSATVLPDGFEALTLATLLVPDDYDAWASLGGVLSKVRGDKEAARKMYARASKVSGGHPYPLLNALKMEAISKGSLRLDKVADQLLQAEKVRLAQARETPPIDTPWCLFDLAELRLYQGDRDGFIRYLRRGIATSSSADDIKSFRDSLMDLVNAGNIKLKGLSKGLRYLNEALRDPPD